jgi:hypothetical protein
LPLPAEGKNKNKKWEKKSTFSFWTPQKKKNDVLSWTEQI